MKEPNKTYYTVKKGDEVNSFLMAILRHLTEEQINYLSISLIRNNENKHPETKDI